ncbi:cyclic-phosphate processing receiver domain-containing protein [Rhodococcus globerulus]|uniref:cyclic-phosphate processing receiver domain-containing protein n=1 Tax=Rhodococcus globerulus TaxID=33008 RepID=UPI003145103A
MRNEPLGRRFAHTPDRSEWAKTSAEAIARLEQGGVEKLSLDQDIGGDDTTRPAVLWMCENEVWPREIRVTAPANTIRTVVRPTCMRAVARPT